MATASADARFSACLAETLKWEGGFSNDPYDPGGATMNGITQRVYDAYRLRKHLSKQSVRNIAPAERDEIYRATYWDEVNGDRLPAGVDLVTWDYGVNSGPSRAIKSLQKALGVVPDGHMGEITERAICNCDPTEIVNKVMDERRAFLKALKTFWRFGRGWMRRCDGIEQAALKMAGMAVSDATVTPHPDVQETSQAKAEQKPPTSTVTTPTGQAAGTAGVAGNAVIGVQVAHAAQAAYTPDKGMDIWLFLLSLAGDPVFWAGAAVVVAACAAWIERSKLLHNEAV